MYEASAWTEACTHAVSTLTFGVDRSTPVIPAKAGTHGKCGCGTNLVWLPERRGRASMKQPCMYMLASEPNGILYIGVTSQLHQRMAQHDQGLIDGFTKKYGIKRLVYYEIFATMPEAILREKRLKEWQRAWKVRLILGMNPEWLNLYDPATGEIAAGPADLARLRREQ